MNDECCCVIKEYQYFLRFYGDYLVQRSIVTLFSSLKWSVHMLQLGINVLRSNYHCSQKIYIPLCIQCIHTFERQCARDKWCDNKNAVCIFHLNVLFSGWQIFDILSVHIFILCKRKEKTFVNNFMYQIFNKLPEWIEGCFLSSWYRKKFPKCSFILTNSLVKTMSTQIAIRNIPMGQFYAANDIKPWR